MKIRFKKHIIIREERDNFLLYNGMTGALIKVEKEAFTKLFDNYQEYDDLTLGLFNCLNQNGFCICDANISYFSYKTEPSNRNEFIDGFFDLRSDINPLNILWAITPKCNLKCIYCFPDSVNHRQRFKDPSKEIISKVTSEIVNSKVLKVTLSGGESLLSPHIWYIVEKLKRNGVTVTVLSNGTTITDVTISKFKFFDIGVGISIDSPNEDVNCITRGSGVFERTLNAIKKCVHSDIPVTALVTLTRYNFPLLREHFQFLSDIGIKSITLQDLRPFGDKNLYNKTRLSNSQEKDLKSTFDEILNYFPHLTINPTELFIFSKKNENGKIMQCPAGENFAYIDFYGDLFPCTSLLNYKLGNLFNNSYSLEWFWQNSTAIHKLRELKNMSIDKIHCCSVCINKNNCCGGCRGDALTYNNDLFGVPSRCPISMN